MPVSPPPSRLRRVLRLVFGSIGLLFIVLAARELARGFDPRSVRVDFWLLSLSLPFALLATAVQSEAWLRLLDAWTGRRITRPTGRALFFASQIARYTPGKVGLPAVRFAGAASLGVTPQVMASTLLLEVLTWCTTGGCIAGLMLTFFPHALGALAAHILGFVAFGCGLVGLLILVFVDRRFLPLRIHSWLHLSGTGPLLPGPVVGLYCVHWFSWIAHGSILALALGASAAPAVLIGVSLVLGIAAGFLAFLAPAGAGVREAVIATIAAPVLGSAGALAVGLIARGVSLLMDVLLWVVTDQWARRAPPKALR